MKIASGNMNDVQKHRTFAAANADAGQRKRNCAGSFRFIRNLDTHKVLRNIQTSVHSAHTVEMMKLANIYNNFAQAYPVCASRFVREIERLRRCRNRFPWQFYVCFNLVCSILFFSSLISLFQKSSIPLYQKMWNHMQAHPELFVRSYEEGIHRVRTSNGNYALLIESPKNDYSNEQEPCDTMKIGQNLDTKGYGIGTPLGSPLR